MYTSDALSALWSVDGKSLGFCTVGKVTFESAAYVARYVMKKWSKENLEGDDLYKAMEGLSNEQAKKKFYGDRHCEYVTMSRRPGIGSFWYDKFKDDIYPSGFAVLPGGKKVRLPKFYDSRFEIDSLFDFAMMKGERLVRAQEDPNNTRRRLEDREAVKLANSKKLTRGYENDC